MRYLLSIIIVLFSTNAFSETIILKSGKEIEGEIIEQTNEYLKVDSGIGIPITYYLDEVQNISNGPLNLNKQEEAIDNIIEQPSDMFEGEQTGGKNDEERIFGNLLDNLLAGFSEEKDKFDSAVDEMKVFVNQHPESIYADDATFIYLSLIFEGFAVDGDEVAANKITDKMAELVGTYSGKGIEAFTRNKCLENGLSIANLAVPYDNIIEYMRGRFASSVQDYEAVIRGYSMLKDVLDYDTDQSGALAGEIYGKMAQSYKALGRMDDLNNIVSEGIEKFPDNQKLVDLLKEISEK